MEKSLQRVVRRDWAHAPNQESVPSKRSQSPRTLSIGAGRLSFSHPAGSAVKVDSSSSDCCRGVASGMVTKEPVSTFTANSLSQIVKMNIANGTEYAKEIAANVKEEMQKVNVVHSALLVYFNGEKYQPA